MQAIKRHRPKAIDVDVTAHKLDGIICALRDHPGDVRMARYALRNAREALRRIAPDYHQPYIGSDEPD